MTVAGRTFCTRCGTSVGSGAFFCPRCGPGMPVVTDEAAATVATPASGPPAGQRIGQLDALRRATLGEYDVLGELGHGGMATVYLAHDLALDRKVAIKVLAPALLAMGEGMVERFKREARTAAALTHPHIIPIYTVKEADRVLYFVMKYVQGRPLDAIIREVGPLPLRLARAILAQVADALGYAHRHGVIHRDIKTANIMLDEEGWAVVTDFGIAKVMQAQGLTMTGVTVGTPTYMSPEQCATTEEVTGASDQYSLGVVAYEMLTGTVPFQDDSIMSIMYAHFNQPPRPVTELRPDCPPNLAAAVMRMLEKDPASRWPSMDDVVAVCGRPSLRRDDPIRQQMSSLARAAGHLVGPKTPSSPIALSRVRTRPTFRRPRRWLWPTVGAAVALGGALALWRLLGSGTPGTAAPVATVRDSVPAAAARPDSSRAVVRPVPSVAAQRDDSMIGSLRTSALRAAQRAALAGATPGDLSPGQTAFASGESLAAARRVAEAMMQFATASAQWADAERQARARGTRDTAPRRVAESPPAQPAAPLPAPPPAPPPAPVPVASVAPDPRPEIEKVIADYATAIESRDIEQVRHAYPGLTTAQQGSWQTFFDRVRNLKATLTVANLSLTATTADAGVSGVYEYDNASTGRPERRPVTFRATLARDAGGWRITAIR